MARIVLIDGEPALYPSGDLRGLVTARNRGRMPADVTWTEVEEAAARASLD